MIDFAYESFVNNATMELFGLSEKERNDKFHNKIDNMSDKELGDYIAKVVLSNYIKKQKEIMLKFGSEDNFYKDFNDRIFEYTDNPKNFKVDSYYVDGRFIEIHPWLYTEILLSGNLNDRKTIKSRSLGFNPIPKDILLYGLLLNMDEIYEKYGNKNDLPKILVLNPWNGKIVPIYDENVGLMCI